MNLACNFVINRPSLAMELLDQIRADLGAKYVVTGNDAEAWTRDWTNVYHWQPLAVVRHAYTEQVQAFARACFAAGVAWCLWAAIQA